MALRLARWVWVALVLVNIGIYVIGAVVYYRELGMICDQPMRVCHELERATAEDVAQLKRDGLSLQDWALGKIVYRVVVTAIFWGVAFLIFARKSDEWVGLLISFFLFSFGGFSSNFTVLVNQYPFLTQVVTTAKFLTFVSFALFFATFPNGKVTPKVMWIPVIIWSAVFFDDAFLGWIPKNNPLAEAMTAVVWLGMFGSGAAAQVYRYRRASGEEERRQTKWVVFGITVLAGSFFFLFFSPLGSQFGERVVYSLRHLLLLIAANSIFTVIPVTIGIAILRYQLFDIDRIIRRTVVYAVLTALLAGAYMGSVVALQSVIPAAGQNQSPVVIVISTLAVAALFSPLRRRIQGFIDRRFYRQKYDAEQVLAGLSARLRDEVNLDEVTRAILAVVAATVQPESFGLWMRKEHNPKSLP